MQDDEPQTWDERHTRVVFYCPREVLAAIREETGRSRRSKSRIIIDALRQHLNLEAKPD